MDFKLKKSELKCRSSCVFPPGKKNQIFDQFKKNSYDTQDKKCRTNHEDYENVVDQAYFL